MIPDTQSSESFWEAFSGANLNKGDDVPDATSSNFSDTSENPEHSSGSLSQYEAVEIFFSSMYSPITPSLLIQSDPLDKIVLESANYGWKESPMSLSLWMRSIDLLLYDYFLLAKRKGNEEIIVNFPVGVHETYINTKNAGSSSGKNLCFRPGTVVPGQVVFNQYTVPYRICAWGPSSYVNQLSRILFLPSNSSDKHASLFHDGLKFRLGDGKPDYVPKFKLEDFIIHELQTGISLSIEIASILLEFDDRQLRNRALKVFCQQALPIVVKSPFIYSRITASRLFFQQILFVTTEFGNNSHYAHSLRDGSSVYWKQLINLALSHISQLTTTAGYYPVSGQGYVQFSSPLNHDVSTVPDDKIEVAMCADIEDLSQIKYPLNVKEILENPDGILAVFCQSAHKNVSSYLQLLAEDKAINLPIPRRSRSQEHLLFQSVHKQVRQAIESIETPLFY